MEAGNAKKTAECMGTDYAQMEGAGAAGGLGFAFVSYLGARLVPDTGCKVIAFAAGLLYGYPAGCEPYKNRICGSGSYYIWYYIKCDLLSVAQPGSPKKGIEIEMFRHPAIFFFDE